MATSYAQWTLSDLERESARIGRAIESARRKERQALVEEIEALARKGGMSLDELVAETARKPKKRGSAGKTTGRVATKVSASKGRKVPPKYRNKKNVEQTWSGRGRAPLWIVELEEKGGSRESMLIK